MLSVCRGPVRCGLARLDPVFTQPLRPDWEALFSHPGAFQRKPPVEAPRQEVDGTERLAHCLIPADMSAARVIVNVSMEHCAVRATWAVTLK